MTTWCHPQCPALVPVGPLRARCHSAPVAAPNRLGVMHLPTQSYRARQSSRGRTPARTVKRSPCKRRTYGRSAGVCLSGSEKLHLARSPGLVEPGVERGAEPEDGEPALPSTVWVKVVGVLVVGASRSAVQIDGSVGVGNEPGRAGCSCSGLRRLELGASLRGRTRHDQKSLAGTSAGIRRRYFLPPSSTSPWLSWFTNAIGQP